MPLLAAEVPTVANGGISADGLTYTYHLRDDVRWHDGTPFTADDVIFSHQVITEKGHPYYQSYWGSIVTATKLDDLNVRFEFEKTEE